jgi:polygalacturonase
MLMPMALSGFVLPARAAGAAHGVWNVLDMGAVGDGKTKNTTVIQKVLDQAASAGGGTVVIPAGTFVTGSLVMGSHTTLHLDPGAVLLGSPDLADYISSAARLERGRYLLFANGAQQIAVTGTGMIDGNSPSFLKRAKHEPFEKGKEWLDVAIFEWQPVKELAAMVHFTGCTGVQVSGVTLRHSPRWTLVLDACDTVSVDGVRIRNLKTTPESDGIDIVCSRNVVVRGCDVMTGDDAMCLKSDTAGEAFATRNVLVTDCLLTGCCNGFKIGTGSKGITENVQFTNSVIYNTETAVTERLLGAVCLEMVDGGVLDDVRVSGIQIRNARTPLFVRLGQRSGGAGTLRNVLIEDVVATGAISASSITGLPGIPVRGVTLRNVQLGTAEAGTVAMAAQRVEELPEHYPEAVMFEHLPAYGVYVRHAEEVLFDQVRTTAELADERPALICEDVQGLELNGLHTKAPQSEQPVVLLRDCREVMLRNSQAPEGTRTYLRVTGPRSAGIRLAGNELRHALHPIQADDPGRVTVQP